VAFTPSKRPLAARLRLTEGARVMVLGEPPPGAETWPGHRCHDDADVVIVSCRSETDVTTLVPIGLAARDGHGRLWLAYDRRARGFGRTALGAAVDALGLDLTWFRQTALEDGWSAIWFKRRSEFRTVRH
jgi:hypothetical protein